MAVYMLSFFCELGVLVVTLLHIKAERRRDPAHVDNEEYLFASFSFCCSFVTCIGNIVGADTMLREARRALTVVASTSRRIGTTAMVRFRVLTLLPCWSPVGATNAHSVPCAHSSRQGRCLCQQYARS